MSSKVFGFLLIAALAAMVMPAVAQEPAAPAEAPVAEAVDAAVQPGMKVTLPCKIYGNCEDEGEAVFIGSGWMGSTDFIEYDDCWKENPHSGESCIKCVFSDPKTWGGIVWQNPANNWGDEEGGVDLTGAKQLSFWARGDKGNEMVEFKMGLIAKNKPFWDTGKASLGKITLTKDWKQYVIPLEGKDLSRIMTGFSWTAKGRADPVVFYIDDIVYE